jgi:hypothetical protein
MTGLDVLNHQSQNVRLFCLFMVVSLSTNFTNEINLVETADKEKYAEKVHIQ